MVCTPSFQTLKTGTVAPMSQQVDRKSPPLIRTLAFFQIWCTAPCIDPAQNNQVSTSQFPGFSQQNPSPLHLSGGPLEWQRWPEAAEATRSCTSWRQDHLIPHILSDFLFQDAESRDLNPWLVGSRMVHLRTVGRNVGQPKQPVCPPAPSAIPEWMRDNVRVATFPS